MNPHPNSAEGKAISRLKAIEDGEQVEWVTVVEEGEEVDVDAAIERLKGRGLSRKQAIAALNEPLEHSPPLASMACDIAKELGLTQYHKQYRFPRTKNRRIRYKWAKKTENYRDFTLED